ncbi:MAG: very short patch repair endonuclease [Thermoanaerobaculia bacterium]|nr:very short patch repair endonuclease [Thermoanaerobaculia bacterium]
MVGRPPPASDAETRRRMLHQRRSDTGPERAVRRVLARLGHRFRLANSDLPGSPDIANRSKRWAVFVHGCFWHRHAECPRATVPKRNRVWWEAKFRDNQQRDTRKAQALQSAGYRVVIVWECETRDVNALERKLARAFPSRSRPPRRSAPPARPRPTPT